MLKRFVTGTLKMVPRMRFFAQIPIQMTKVNRFNFSTSEPGKTNKNQPSNQQLKKQSKQFYENYVQKVVQLKSSADFQKLVVSIKQPIVLDLYADWCGPCKKLTPRLQSKVKSLDGVKMIKVNIDKCPQIAQALQVKSVPTVYLLYQGQAVDKIQGNVGQPQFNKFFETINKITGISSQSKQAMEALEVAKKLMSQQKNQQAADVLQKFKQKKVSIDLVAIKQLLLCQCYLSLNKASKFKDSLARAAKHEEFFKQAPELNQFYEILKSGSEKLEQQSKDDPQILNLKSKVEKASDKNERLQAKFELVNYYKTKQLMQNALETAMQIIKQDKNWQQKKANQLVLSIFKQLGNNSPLVQKYRRVLQRLLS